MPLDANLFGQVVNMYQLEQSLDNFAAINNEKNQSYYSRYNYSSRYMDYCKPGSNGQKINDLLKNLKHMKDKFIIALNE